MKAVTWRAFILLGSLLGAAAPSHPAGAQPSGVIVPGVVEGDVVEGRVNRVDPETRTLTLDNGREYLVPPALVPVWQLLQPGAAVKLRYSVDGGRNVATHLDVRP